MTTLPRCTPVFQYKVEGGGEERGFWGEVGGKGRVSLPLRTPPCGCVKKGGRDGGGGGGEREQASPHAGHR